ncbi:lysozyme inhibitor LprI family protein [Simiduia agarivorans]|uniref:Lysozyme inhibitor LprI-like N-terminal domain-containing protein n=1 Tax=Simiduia agarivorans (strain DSM 21679 / JCM 13881 / BCRC 17597 / SA1) TaxID=1117647 RepID=K4KWE6_SIMAS|nr:lysozyme inhibitor LprI family protein [Simiduia agarivorans]AFU98232.1 hypothetical protein M5M_05135 [Simiduia agarivorans SA1 = DSM 21679]
MKPVLPGLLVFALMTFACQAQDTDIQPPAQRMHPSWDLNGDGINDCETDGSCDHSVDYTQPRNTQPTFDCRLAESQVTEHICAHPQLGLLDQHLARAFRLAQSQAADPAMLKAEQRGWIKGRDDCWKSDDLNACITDAYKRRIAELESGRFAGQSLN